MRRWGELYCFMLLWILNTQSIWLLRVQLNSCTQNYLGLKDGYIDDGMLQSMLQYRCDMFHTCHMALLLGMIIPLLWSAETLSWALLDDHYSPLAVDSNDHPSLAVVSNDHPTLAVAGRDHPSLAIAGNGHLMVLRWEKLPPFHSGCGYESRGRDL